MQLQEPRPTPRRGTAAAVTSTVLLALPALVVLPALATLGVSSGPSSGVDLAPLAVGLLWLVLGALPLIAWFRQSWTLALPALAIAVAGIAYGVVMFFSGLELARQECTWVFCDVGIYLGPVIAGYFIALAVTIALLVSALLRVRKACVPEASGTQV
jgi:hypothetical protein